MMPMTAGHIVKAYDAELNQLRGFIVQMGSLVEDQFREAIQAVHARDNDIAVHAFASDVDIDSLEFELNELALKLLALRQPMASDLRLIIGTMRIARDLERMGDYAANLAKRARKLNIADPMTVTAALLRLANLVGPVIHGAVDAFASDDLNKAAAINALDDPIDEEYNRFIKEVVAYMQAHPTHIETCSQLLFMAKNLERIGDRATNIAETVQFILGENALAVMRKPKILPQLEQKK
jgi:phosphate transport system protein